MSHRIFENLSKRLKPSRIGDLLVKTGAITQDQLILALKAQKQIEKPLGQLLIDLGFVSPLRLWRALARQASIRFAATALGLVIGVSSFGMTKTASAETFSSQKTKVQTASIMRAPDFSNKAQKSIRLFGSAEKKSLNKSAFTKWNVAIEKTNRTTTASDGWVQDIKAFAHLSLDQKIKKVDGYVNRIRYVEDRDNWGTSDYWATPDEMFARGAGDCEDYALAKYKALKMLGIPKENMRMAVVKDTVKNIPHAVLIVYSGSDAYILDNQSKQTKKVSQVSRYQPIYSINETAWWRHTS